MLSEKPRALIVDDEDGIRTALRRELEFAGYLVLDTGDPRLALDFLMLYRIDLLITDQRMPLMNGDELLRRAFSHTPETTKVMLSGYSDFNGVVNALNQGALHGFIHKPWVPEELQHQIYVAAKNRFALAGQLQNASISAKY